MLLWTNKKNIAWIPLLTQAILWSVKVVYDIVTTIKTNDLADSVGNQGLVVQSVVSLTSS